MTAVNHLVALTRLAAYAPVLPEDLRIQAPAWDLEGLDHYLPAASGSGANTPSLDRCRAGCPNIARTDAHAAGLRRAAAALRLQAGASLTPEPVADRLRHRAGQLAAQADEHDRSRLTPATEDLA
jgi:hypothetical protein